MKITKTATVTVSGKRVKELKEILAQIPDHAQISVVHHPGDHSYTEFKFTWTD